MAREAELIQKVKMGEQRAFNELIALYYPAILRYCSRRMPDRQTAEDATQETFYKAFLHFEQYTHQGKFQAYLYRIAQNICIDLARKKRAIPLEESVPYFESQLTQVDADADFQSLIRSLPVQQQEIMELRFGHDLTLRQISEIMGLPLRTVQSRLRSALKRLKETLQKGVRG